MSEASYPVTPTSSVDGMSKALMPYLDICAVCGGQARLRHFGVRTCNACAAFFRRTVARKLAYVCRRGKNCIVKNVNQRRTCRYCRFQSCMRVGMDVSAVIAPAAPFVVGANDSGDFLGRIMAARRAIYVNRNHATVHVYGGHERILVAANQFRNSYRMHRAVDAEVIVVSDFLRLCDIEQINEQREWRRRYHFSWELGESLLATLRNSGTQTGRFYYADDSYLTANYDDLYRYYRANPDVRNADICARFVMDYFKETLAVAGQLRRARLDDAEWAALIFMFTVKDVETNLGSGRPLFRTYFEDVMCSLKRHYESNYEDVAIRLGNLILLLGELNRVRRLFDELSIVLRVSGKKSVYDK